MGAAEEPAAPEASRPAGCAERPQLAGKPPDFTVLSWLTRTVPAPLREVRKEQDRKPDDRPLGEFRGPAPFLPLPQAPAGRPGRPMAGSRPGLSGSVSRGGSGVPGPRDLGSRLAGSAARGGPPPCGANAACRQHGYSGGTLTTAPDPAGSWASHVRASFPVRATSGAAT
ncbi:hypothetical protein San01_01580 [Streptomyces angustmyceticus]|uniref:Uncharacterized protein n=1 Tax=Streptomyces angustmyceticus TaxID=285578 RepID=A0A5J4L644_9ACTN|nr:hypothetical protein San01_01580 [Streptomyces angustmyceticus]